MAKVTAQIKVVTFTNHCVINVQIIFTFNGKTVVLQMP